MSTSRKAVTYGVTYRDLVPWLSQLKDDHQIDVTFTVTLPQAPGGLQPAVVMSATITRGLEARREVKRDYRCFEPKNTGQVERECLQMLSALLLERDNMKAEMEAAQLSLWDK